MAVRRSSRDGVISLLVVLVGLAGWWWLANGTDSGLPVTGATSVGVEPTPAPTSTTTSRPVTAVPSTSRPVPPTTPSATATRRPFTPVPSGRYAVRWVSDGDTFSITSPGGQGRTSVRIIGLNAPEVAHGAVRAECYGPQAAARLEKLLIGQAVVLVDDPRAPLFDRFGRRLAYVEVAGQDVATTMIRDGFAVEFHLPSVGPSVRTPTYERAEAEAAKAKRGLWGSCPAQPGPP